MIKYLRYLLFPFSILYGIVVFVRNKLYDIGVFKATGFDIPVICVGNLVVGGSGKSPVTEYLVRLFPNRKIAILSRGYGRKTKGFILADDQATAETIGDEPMQFYRKFPQVTVAVCEDRVLGAGRLQQHHDLIILDDAYQHRAISAGFNILLFEFEKLLKPQFLLPTGNLRESFSGYKRAQSILITKSPDNIKPDETSKCLDKFEDHWQKEAVFSSLIYQDLVPLISGENQICKSITQETTVFLLTGIANPKPLLQYLGKYTAKIRHHDYPDHYRFTEGNINDLVAAFNSEPATEKIIITTEKDAQRLLGGTLKELLLNLPIFYLPVKIGLSAKDKIIFDQKIIAYVSSHTRNR
ncbi:tetraacyldisaccharide 4'-kinase [Pedobacter sp. PACM 27299]|uniref:tetraacyldisaccharide 4'-kinase n=1 Tax=Pedobacter sp. PACM 27299 TaxID=1727164 RepID=UPI0007058808|nr:tetraacyldisaccharide 4'-kinase [Pedobacter sp. PACM 27299]ALL08168.1 tetraacyldisaccharide 4'-kinase [Pedobacter sp. PACM 27299]